MQKVMFIPVLTRTGMKHYFLPNVHQKAHLNLKISLILSCALWH